MSKKFSLPVALGVFLIGLFSLNVSQAQTNAYFDPNGTNNAGEGGSGTWSTSQTIWTTNSVNATANSGGPTGGGLFAVANAASGATLTNSGNFIFNFGGTAGTVNQGGAYQAFGVNFLTTGYTWNIDGSGTNSRGITTTNGINLNGNALTLANGSKGLNSFTFSSANGINGSSGANLTLRNLVADTATNSFGVYLSGGTISSNIGINVDIGTGSKLFLGSQSSSGATINSAITLNTNASGVALDITNSASGTVALNGVVSGANGLVLNNSGTGKISLTAANTYTGGTTLNSVGTGEIIYSNVASFGTGIITANGSGTTNYIRSAVNNLNLTNAQVISLGNTLRMAGTTSTWTLTNSGSISGEGALQYNNSGTLYLTGTDNSFGGGVILGSSGTLYFNKFGASGLNSSLGTNGTITVGIAGQNSGNGTLRWIGTANEISDKVINLGSSTNGVAILANGATNGSLTLNGNINSVASGAKTFTFAGYSTNTLTLNGVINENGGVNSVVIGASSSGTVVLGNTNNSFSGAITVTNSTSGQSTYLSAANIGNAGSNSALGQNGTINIGSGSSGALTGLKYTGTGETSDKVINLAGTTGGAILDQSGTGNLKFTSQMTATGVGAKAITLQGSATGTGELARGISDLGGNVISLNKYGTGNWTLSGNNSYSGNTTIRDTGVLKVTSTGSLSQNSSLLGSSSSSTVGTLDLQAGGSYVANSYGTAATGGFNMNFTNSSLVTATLRFTNAENYVTIAANNSGGRTLLNQSTNLDVKFDGNIEIGSSSNEVVAFGGAGNFRVDGAIKNSGVGVRGLEKTGAGTLTLAGSGNNYNGSTSVKGGTLEVGVSGALPNNTSISVSSGAKLKFNQSSGGVSVGAMTVAGTLEQELVTITSLGAVDLSNSTLQVNGMPTLDSYTLVEGSSVTGNPTLSGAFGYQLSVDSTSVKLVKSVTGSTYEKYYAPGSEGQVGSNGLTNLMNYALGGTGTSSSPALPVLTSDANGLTLTANIRNDDNSGLNVVGQYAYSLEGPWNDVQLTPTGSTSAVPNTTTKSFTQSVDPSQPRKFLRIKVTK
jgi:fibronectin-binding autotransporter adhesin